MSEVIKTTVEYVADYNKLPALPPSSADWSRSRRDIWYKEAREALLIAKLVDQYII